MISGVLKTSLVMKWLRLHASTAGGAGSIPAGGTFHKIPQATMCSQKKKKFWVNYVCMLSRLSGPTLWTVAR